MTRRPDIVIHKADTPDAETLASLIQSAFEEYRGTLEPPSGAHGDTADVLRARMANGSAVIATAEGIPVGCVFYQHFPDYTYLGRLAVLPPHRGNGIARALIRYVEARARERGQARVRLGTRLVLTELRDYYARQDYVEAELGTHLGCMEPTFVFMEKRL